MTAGYYPDHDYELRRMNGDDCLDPLAAYYLQGQDLYRAQQLVPRNPVNRFEGKPVGHVELNSSLRPYRVLAGAKELGEIELATGVFTSAEGERYWLKPIQL